MVTAMAAGKRLAERSGWKLSNLELQKIMYLAHMFHMGRHDGKPLIGGSFEAWDYGPVHPGLYNHVKIFGADPVGNIFRSVPSIPNHSDEARSLDDALHHLKGLSPAKLVAITHAPNGAWNKNYIPGARGVTIPNADILKEYEDRARRAAAKQAA